MDVVILSCPGWVGLLQKKKESSRSFFLWVEVKKSEKKKDIQPPMVVL